MSNKATQSNGLTIDLSIVTDKGNKKSNEMQVANFSKAVGEILKENEDKLTFSFNGCTITVPSSKNTDGQQRFFSLVKGLTTAIFTGIEQDSEPKDKAHRELLQSIQKCGFHFPNLQRVSVLEGVNIRIKAKTSVIRLSKTVTREMKENKTFIQVTNTANELNKIVKAEGMGAALKRLEEMKAGKTDAGLKLIELS